MTLKEAITYLLAEAICDSNMGCAECPYNGMTSEGAPSCWFEDYREKKAEAIRLVKLYLTPAEPTMEK